MEVCSFLLFSMQETNCSHPPALTLWVEKPVFLFHGWSVWQVPECCNELESLQGCFSLVFLDLERMKPPGLDAFLACFSVDTFLSNPGNRQFCHCLNSLSLTSDSSRILGQFSWDTIFPQHWFPSGHCEFFNQIRTGDFLFRSGHIHWSCPRSKDCLAREEFDAEHLRQLVWGIGLDQALALQWEFQQECGATGKCEASQ